jgi:hypothetical protein
MPDIEQCDTPKAEGQNGVRSPGLSIDWALYRRTLEDTELSDEDKEAFIEALWNIMVAFVDLGFRLNPLPEICGEIDPLAALAEKSVLDMVNSQHTTKSFNMVAIGPPPVGEEGGADGS